MKGNQNFIDVIQYLNHRRILLFWLVVLVFLTLPWTLKGCRTSSLRESRVFENCGVISIHDGDTMTLRCEGRKIRVRLYCIDAPELAQKPWGGFSRDHLRKAADEMLRLRIYDQDRYGRVIGEVYQADKNLNLHQVLSGNASVYERYCREQSYSEAQSVSRRSGIGIWATEGLHQTPWLYRRKNRNAG